MSSKHSFHSHHYLEYVGCWKFDIRQTIVNSLKEIEPLHGKSQNDIMTVVSLVDLNSF